MVLAALFAAVLALPAFGQEAGQANIGCFFGLNDADSPAVLSPCESPAMLNVESNLQGTAFLKRKGFDEIESLSCTTCPVTGSHSFIDSSGNRLDIICYNRYCAKKTNGNAAANFLTVAASSATRWSFVDSAGVLYGGNNAYDPIIKYDGTTLSRPSGMPKGSILELADARLVIADISGNPNRVHYSSAGAVEQFTTGVNPEDSFFDEIGAPGDKVRGLRCVNGVCYVFKTASITACEVKDQYATACAVISPNIGTTDPGGIVTAGSCLYFRAQDKSYWELCREGLRPISQKIPNLVNSQSGGLAGGERINTQTTQADWEAGSESPANTWDTTTTPGSIFPSSITFVDNSTANWTAGAFLLNIDTATAATIRLTSTTYRDDWSNSLVAGRLVWTRTDGSWAISAPSGGGTYLRATSGSFDLSNLINTSSVTLSSGSWSFVSHHTATEFCSISGTPETGVCWEFRFMKNAGNSYYGIRLNENLNGGDSQTHPVALFKNVEGAETVFTRRQITVAANTDHTWDVHRSTDGRLFLFKDSVFISSTPADTAITSSTKLEIAASAHASGQQLFDSFYAYQYASSGTVLSRTFDTVYSTPTFGTLSSTWTALSGEGQVNFYTQSSNDGTTWTAYSASSDTLRNVSAPRRYVRYRMDVNTWISTKTPTITSVALNAATTGQFRTQCIQPNSAINAWGALSCAETKTGAGSLVYYATSAASCATLPAGDPATWVGGAQTNNATLTIDTNTAVYVGWRSLLGSATEQAQVDACTLAWNEGTPVQPAWAVYDSVKNAIYWTATVNNAQYTNRLLKYDRNLEQWYPFDVPAQAPRMINNTLYFGGASSGTWNSYGGVDADNGAVINAYRDSKDIGSEQPFNEKDFKTLSLLMKNAGTGNLTATYTFSNGETGAYTVSLSTGSGITYARYNENLPSTSPQNFLKIRVGNNSAVPFEVLGLGVKWHTREWQPGGP